MFDSYHKYIKCYIPDPVALSKYESSYIDQGIYIIKHEQCNKYTYLSHTNSNMMSISFSLKHHILDVNFINKQLFNIIIENYFAENMQATYDSFFEECEQIWTDSTKTEQVSLGVIRLGQIKLGLIRLGQVRLGWDETVKITSHSCFFV